MDKEEFRIKLEEINRLVVRKDYKNAMKVVDSIDWRRVKNVRTLCVVGEIYAANERLEDSKEIFLLAYHRAPIGKNILYRLVEISLKMGDIDEAKDFYEEYKEVAPDDSTLCVLKYKILSESKAPIQEQIKVLEKYKKSEFTEKWSYELAKLYYQAGEMDKCLDLCNEIIVWFNDGNYVMQAMDLKQRMGKLTGEEKERYEQNFVPKLMTPEELKNGQAEGSGEDDSEDDGEEDEPEIGRISINNEKELGSVESFQEKISKGIRDIFGGNKKDEDSSDEEDEAGDAIPEELIKSPSKENPVTDAPELEQEGSKGIIKNEIEKAASEASASLEGKDSSEGMKIPKLTIPDSMKNFEEQASPEVPKVQLENVIPGGGEEEKKEPKEFNLEDTILAAASAQGIEIPEDAEEVPEEEPLNASESEKEVSEASGEESPDDSEKGAPEKETPDDSEKEFSEVSGKETLETPEEEFQEVPEKKNSPVELKEEGFLSDDEEDEVLSEEDLKAAEEEFLNGPKKMPKQEEAEQPAKALEIPRLEDEEIFQENYDDIQDEDIVDVPDEEEAESLDEEPLTGDAVSGNENYENENYEDSDAPEKEEISEEEELEQFIDSIQPKDERDPLDIIPREKELTEEEKKLFTYFVKVPGLAGQISEALLDAQLAAADKTSRTGNIIVMGGRETGKTRLIAGLIPAICKERNIEASKVAYVFAKQINGLDMSKVVDKLSGGFLVIENANQLTKETVRQLSKAMDFRTDGLTVILEDEKISMRKLIARFPKFSKKFTSIINIPVFTNDELVNFARVYTKENGYRIDQMGMLALYNLIGINQKEDEPMNIGAVKDMLDAAIAKSQGGLLKLGKKKRVDRDGYIVLYEKDFAK